MIKEFEYIFFKYTAKTKPVLQFDECTECNKTTKLKDHVKWEAEYNKSCGRVMTYSIQVFDFYTNERKLLINYNADSKIFNPEKVNYYEPDWKTNFSDSDLNKALDYLEACLEMKMTRDRDHYLMLIFKDHFHIAIRTKHVQGDLEHNLCITAYNVNLKKDINNGNNE